MFFTCNPCCSQNGPIAKSERNRFPFKGFLDRKRKAVVLVHHVWQSSALMRHNIDSVPPVQPDVNGPVFA
ncbi:hypothetical protein HanRHA438_Chr04g0155591 [Helianthus annuus]|nr:hypothetical protein HanRHA438_Chr04g0155591 [Helianthus annuus]